MLHSTKLIATLLFALLPTVPTHAADVSQVPAWACNQALPPPPEEFACLRAGVRCTEPSRPLFRQEPSRGSGGAFPGAVARTVLVGSPPVLRTYFAYVPETHSPTKALPVLLVLHGAGGAGTATSNARLLRDAWKDVAEAREFIVVAPISTGSGGGWLPERDYYTMAAVLEDLAAHYNIDRSRIHGWGFSAGGHVLHDIALNQHLPNLGSDTFAAYAVAAGVLEAYACNSVTSCNALLDAAPRKIPVTLRVGVTDPYFHTMQSNYNRFAARGWVAGESVEWAALNGGHEIFLADFNATWDFLCPFQHLHTPARPPRRRADKSSLDR